jgi:hypothetical protein
MAQQIERSEYVLNANTTNIKLNTIVGNGIVNTLTKIKLKGKLVKEDIVGVLEDFKVNIEEDALGSNLIVHVDITNSNKVPNTLHTQLIIEGGSQTTKFTKLQEEVDTAQQAVTFSYYIKLVRE